jgi:hypothetical protein
VPRLLQHRGEEFVFSLRHMVGMLHSLFIKDRVFFYVSSWVTPFYHISIPFFLIGTVAAISKIRRSLKHSNFDALTLVCIWIATYFSFGLFLVGPSDEGPYLAQLNGMYWGILFIILYGIIVLLDWLKQKAVSVNALRMAPKVFLGILLITYSMLFAFFCFDYFHLRPTSWDAGEIEENVSASFGGITADYDSLGEAIAYLETIPDEVRQRTTYIRHVQVAEMHYLLLQRIPATEIVDQRIKDGRVWYFRQYSFRKPDNYSLEENYIVAHWQTDELEELQSIGFSDVQRFGKYWVFSHP